MQTKDEFLRKYLGQKIEYDGVAPYQCVDYIKLYLKKCFGISPGSWGDARQYFIRFNDKSWDGFEQMHKYFYRITGKTLPQKGDIVVLEGTYGHVGVASGRSDNKYYWMYEQNFQSNKFVQLNQHMYANMLGVLRPKYWTVTADLNIRLTPNGNVIGEYKKNSFIEVIDKKGDWWQTPKGWCFKKYLD